MNWSKLGLIFTPGKYDWMLTHAMCPFPQWLEGSIFKIHFGGRDKDGRARGGYFIINISKPQEILEVSARPTLDLGDLGCFDDCGAIPNCLVEAKDRQFIYYNGRTQMEVTPFSSFIGLAISEDGGATFERYSKAPVLGRNRIDPYMTPTPWVVLEDGVWRMWYASCTKWEKLPDIPVPRHYYHIRYCESPDGLEWNPKGYVCIDFQGDEYAIARPVVYKDDGVYKMWYCLRGGDRAYRAGYAESADGLAWERMDGRVGIDISEAGWDSEMICYPCVFKHEEHTFMLYNGNSYGIDGVGLAVLDD